VLLACSLLARTTHGCSGGVDLLGAFLQDRFLWLAIALTGTFVFHAMTLHHRARLWLLVIGTLSEVLRAIQVSVGSKVVVPFGLGLASSALIVRAVLLVRAREERVLHAQHLFDSLVPAWAIVACYPWLVCTGRLLHQVRDLEIQSMGGALGPWPPILVGQLFSSLPPLHLLCAVIYHCLPVGLTVVHAARLRTDPHARPTLMLAFVLIAVFGYPLYFLLPLVGPREAWACLEPPVAFPPRSPPSAALAWLEPSASALRNCMPSLHTAWSLTLALEARRLSRPVAAFGILWFLCTELATLGLGEHWLIDLIVAVPYTLAIYPVAAGMVRSPRAWVTVAALAAMVASWMVALCSYAPALIRHPGAVVLAMLATPCAAVILAQQVGTGRPHDLARSVGGDAPVGSRCVRRGQAARA
jgi:hypothetical protein